MVLRFHKSHANPLNVCHASLYLQRSHMPKHRRDVLEHMFPRLIWNQSDSTSTIANKSSPPTHTKDCIYISKERSRDTDVLQSTTLGVPKSILETVYSVVVVKGECIVMEEDKSDFR